MFLGSRIKQEHNRSKEFMIHFMVGRSVLKNDNSYEYYKSFVLGGKAGWNSQSETLNRSGHDDPRADQFCCARV